MTAGRARRRLPGVVTAGALVAGHSFRQFTRSKMLVGVGLIAAFTVIVAFIIARYSGGIARDYQVFQGLLLAPVIAPLVALLIGTSAMGSEREGGTLPYLFTRPIPRAVVVIGKGVAAIVLASVVVAALAFVAFIAMGAPPNVDVVGGALALAFAAAAFTSVFVLLGTVFARSLYVGLAYAALYEGLLGGLVAPENAGSVSYHARNLLMEWTRGAPPGGFGDPIADSAMRSVLVLLGVIVAGLAASAAWVESREYGLRDRPTEE